jgi:hypothetical protein
MVSVLAMLAMSGGYNARKRGRDNGEEEERRREGVVATAVGGSSMYSVLQDDEAKARDKHGRVLGAFPCGAKVGLHTLGLLGERICLQALLSFSPSFLLSPHIDRQDQDAMLRSLQQVARIHMSLASGHRMSLLNKRICTSSGSRIIAPAQGYQAHCNGE